jgi:hypothetical protein
MRRVTWMFLLALTALVSFACSGDGGGNPVAPENAELSTATNAAQLPQTAICHWSPDYLEDGDPFEYTVISINSNALDGHSRHGDPLTCDLVTLGLVEGDDCSACAPIEEAPTDGAPAPTSPSGPPQGKARICHFDVDDEELYDSIVIEISNSAYQKHIDNHGDCDSVDPVGTEDCTCTIAEPTV